MVVEMPTPRDVQTTLNFYAPLDTQPPYNYVDPPPGAQKTNVGTDSRPVVVHDARGRDDALSLDVTGFQFVQHPSMFVAQDFDDEVKIKTVYYAEVENILKKHAGAKRVRIFDHSIRRPIANRARGTPYHRVHADQTPESAIRLVEAYLGDEAERLLKGRYRLINVWRPIANKVAHTPLALADYRTVDPDHDLVSTRHIRPNREGALFNVKYNPGHEWYYLSDQTPDEVTLIKCFDTDVDKALWTPHSAFHDDTSPADAPLRQSIEVRALVFDTE